MRDGAANDAAADGASATGGAGIDLGKMMPHRLLNRKSTIVQRWRRRLRNAEQPAVDTGGDCGNGCG